MKKFNEEIFTGKLHFLCCGRRRGSLSLSNDYLDDLFTLKDLLGLEKLK